MVVELQEVVEELQEVIGEFLRVFLCRLPPSLAPQYLPRRLVGQFPTQGLLRFRRFGPGMSGKVPSSQLLGCACVATAVLAQLEPWGVIELLGTPPCELFHPQN